MNTPAMVAAAALIAGTMAVAPANAVPTLASKNVAEAVKPAKNPYVSQIRSYRYRHHRHHHHGGDWGPWVAGSLLGLGLGYALSDGYDDGYYDDYGPLRGHVQDVRSGFRNLYGLRRPAPPLPLHLSSK
jgi:hypothetical protein